MLLLLLENQLWILDHNNKIRVDGRQVATVRACKARVWSSLVIPPSGQKLLICCHNTVLNGICDVICIETVAAIYNVYSQQKSS